MNRDERLAQEAIRDCYNKRMPSACVVSSDGIERIYYSGFPLNELAAAVVAALRQSSERDAVVEVAMNLDESDPVFCAMVNAARDEHVRLKGFAPYTADIIAMLKAAIRALKGAKP